MTITFRVLLPDGHVAVRRLTVRRDWFGAFYVSVEGKEHRIEPGNTLTLDMPLTMTWYDKLPKE